MWESLILGAVQGMVEWLPVSSEGVIFLIKANFFPGAGVEEILKQALFLHFGTFLAALVYFRKEVGRLLRTLFKYPEESLADRKLLHFLMVTTIISGILGYFLYELTQRIPAENMTAQAITLVVGFLLLITAFIQFRAQKLKKKDFRGYSRINKFDNIILGVAQGAAAFPGLSRSGLTVSALLLRKFEEQTALKMSFLMSLPIVLAGNILLNLEKFNLSLENAAALLASFVFGLLTIKFLLKLAEKINFAFFVLIFGLLTIGAAFV